MGKKKDEFKEKVLDYLIAIKEMYGDVPIRPNEPEERRQLIQEGTDRLQDCLEACIRDIRDENLDSEDSWG
jgi:hypothetical protein